MRTTFERAATAYRLGRPGYPVELYALLASRCGLGPGCAVLEVGAGTGQATRPLLDSGAQVTTVEPGAELLRELRKHCGGRRLRVVSATYEGADLPSSAERHEIRWQGRHDPRQLRALFATFSPWIALPERRRETLLDMLAELAGTRFGGLVVRPYVTLLELRRRKHAA